METVMGRDFQVQWEKCKHRYRAQDYSVHGLESLQEEGRTQGLCSDTVVLNMENWRK